MKPILSFDRDGHVVPIERVRGRENLEARVLALLDERLTPRPQTVALRRGSCRCAGGSRADTRRAGGEIPAPGCFRDLGNRVLGARTSVQGLGIFYQVEDGAPQPIRWAQGRPARPGRTPGR